MTSVPETLEAGLECQREQRRLHIIRSAWSEFQRPRHTEARKQLLCRIGIDRKGAFRFHCVKGYEIGLAAADDDDFSRDRKGEEGFRRDG